MKNILDSVTRLGDIWKFLWQIFLQKKRKSMLTFWAVLKTFIFIYKLQ